MEAQGALGVVESVKAASDVYSPIDGEVVEVTLPRNCVRGAEGHSVQINEALVEDPTLINTDPEGEGW